MAITRRNRIKHLVGYPGRLIRNIPQRGEGTRRDKVHSGLLRATKSHFQSSTSSSDSNLEEDFYDVSLNLDQYGIGNRRSMQDYLSFAEIDFESETCGSLKWCSDGSLD